MPSDPIGPSLALPAFQSPPPPPDPLAPDALQPGWVCCTSLPSPPAREPLRYAVFVRPLEQPPGDGREYRRIRLANGLEVLLVRDAQAAQSGAAMSVGVGNLSDPDELPGLAHLCEHMLFLGTEKYPQDNEYNRFVSHHAGQCNAYTLMDEMLFYFSIERTHLDGALDRFAQFFIAPLFNEKCTEQELKAIDSEFKSKLRVCITNILPLVYTRALLWPFAEIVLD